MLNFFQKINKTLSQERVGGKEKKRKGGLGGRTEERERESESKGGGDMERSQSCEKEHGDQVGGCSGKSVWEGRDNLRADIIRESRELAETGHERRECQVPDSETVGKGDKS